MVPKKGQLHFFKFYTWGSEVIVAQAEMKTLEIP